MEHTRDVMSEVEAVSGLYDGLAVSCSQLYFALETLKDVHFLYHFSLRFFQDILAQVWRKRVRGYTSASGGTAVIWVYVLFCLFFFHRYVWDSRGNAVLYVRVYMIFYLFFPRRDSSSLTFFCDRARVRVRIRPDPMAWRVQGYVSGSTGTDVYKRTLLVPRLSGGKLMLKERAIWFVNRSELLLIRWPLTFN